jgi:hypothetical protein
LKTLSTERVLEQMTTELAARRRMRAAYLALAKVIVYGEEQQWQTPHFDWESASAA